MVKFLQWSYCRLHAQHLTIGAWLWLCQQVLGEEATRSTLLNPVWSVLVIHWQHNVDDMDSELS